MNFRDSSILSDGIIVEIQSLWHVKSSRCHTRKVILSYSCLQITELGSVLVMFRGLIYAD